MVSLEKLYQLLELYQFCRAKLLGVKKIMRFLGGMFDYGGCQNFDFMSR
jgi:hypothetical protein